ncbi:hypothetical protein PUN28_009254 [Cardiocondyla obscurior]|uniref:C2H2-type domain-containing protein n=1 Tax=Cardiocondyla obscurior TaxID=286306 RepID=A0AAW2FW86_9HYME
MQIYRRTLIARRGECASGCVRACCVTADASGTFGASCCVNLFFLCERVTRKSESEIEKTMKATVRKEIRKREKISHIRIRTLRSRYGIFRGDKCHICLSAYTHIHTHDTYTAHAHPRGAADTIVVLRHPHFSSLNAGLLLARWKKEHRARPHRPFISPRERRSNLKTR